MRDEGISRKRDINWFSIFPFPSSHTTATVKFYKNKEEMYLIRYISSNFTPNHNFLRAG